MHITKLQNRVTIVISFMILSMIVIFISMRFSQLSEGKHPIIVQVSPPRCLSTAALRMWQARGDCEVLNEPFIAPFLLKDMHKEDVIKTGQWRAQAPQSYDYVLRKILAMSESKPVFVKEISFALMDLMRTDATLLRNKNVQFVFLIRNPHHIISSYYKILKFVGKNFCYEIGFQALYELYELVEKYAHKKPIIVCAEDLYTNPYDTIQLLCHRLQIPFVEQMMQWEDLGDSFEGVREWHETKKLDVIHHWHKNAIRSTGFHKPSEYEVDQNGYPTFSEVVNMWDRELCFDAYEINKKYYDLLVQEKNRLEAASGDQKAL